MVIRSSGHCGPVDSRLTLGMLLPSHFRLVTLKINFDYRFISVDSDAIAIPPRGLGFAT